MNKYNEISDFALDKELTKLEELKFSELLKICQKVGVLSRRRGTKEQMISEIQNYIVFDVPEEGEYILNA